MPSWAWVVTSFFQTFWLLLPLFQCPHRLELLPNNYDEILEINLFQCHHGLELLPIFITICKLVVMFQCPHGLELLQGRGIKACRRYISFNALMGLSCYDCVRRITALFRCFNALMGLSCYTERNHQCSFLIVSMPLWAWVVTYFLVFLIAKLMFQCPYGLELLRQECPIF